MKRPIPASLLCALLCAAADPPVPAAAAIPPAQYRWAQSPHGAMLARILPPAVAPAQLPEPRSEGARLTVKYCVQCHHLPSPRMHATEKWAPIVNRMNWRMQGNGNLGPLMQEMMADVVAPSADELAALTRYLEQHALKPIDSKQYPDLATPPGRMFGIACSQCHAAPDPKSHTARRWPSVVERMKKHMAWANLVAGAPSTRTEPVLDTDQIVKFLQRHGRTR